MYTYASQIKMDNPHNTVNKMENKLCLTPNSGQKFAPNVQISEDVYYG